MRFEGIPNDTSPTAEAVHIQLLREAGPERRASLMLSMTQTAFSLSRHNLRQKYPDLSETEFNIKFVELLYGADLAERLRAFLESTE